MSPIVTSLRWPATVVAALLALAACGGSPSTSGTTTFKGTKNIGLSIALTGQSALYGHAISQSMKLAADDINAKGGINGYKINADIQDDGTQVANAVNNFKSLILQDNVVAMLGPVTSAQCQATSPIAKENKVIMIAATCNSWQLTTEPDLINPYYISIVPNTYMEGTAAGEGVANGAGVAERRPGRGRKGIQGGGEGGLLGGYAEAADELAGEVLQGGRGGGAAVVGVRPDVQGEQVVEDFGELGGGYPSGAIGKSGAGELVPFVLGF